MYCGDLKRFTQLNHAWTILSRATMSHGPIYHCRSLQQWFFSPNLLPQFSLREQLLGSYVYL